MPSASVRGARWRSAARAVGDRVGVGSLYLVGLAVVVGLGAGLAAVGFRWLIVGATQLFSGTADYAATTGHPANHWVPWLGPAFIVLAPAVGGLVYGPLVHRFAREARGHGVPEVMYAVAQGRAHQGARRRGQGPRLGAHHRLGGLRGARRADRPDRVRARLAPGDAGRFL